ncbi:MAG: GNAT family N-acetyltransferase [Deltaproteobacteria bacterium]|nr:GNAT family N-acetyltransferase [Deltaproteobacteria bacterium]MBW1795752.1 GNAT family N-acetyltransferase [Deltaproteobacteria bacterium]MBW2331177.1 GNAT family N-acetyltransferase [Deltaproteobacteria bacterium]
MAENLTVKTESIKEGDSSYCWVNIELGGTRVGKARIKRIYSRVIIKNITVFPEFQRRGLARKIIDLFKDTAREIIADRVRDTARGFWERMGFSDTGDGNYRWVSCERLRSNKRTHEL